jgi:hypothetical protein
MTCFCLYKKCGTLQQMLKYGYMRTAACTLCQKAHEESGSIWNGEMSKETIGHIQSAGCLGQKEVVTAAHNTCIRELPQATLATPWLHTQRETKRKRERETERKTPWSLPEKSEGAIRGKSQPEDGARCPPIRMARQMSPADP